jgi:hypothetical protein
MRLVSARRNPGSNAWLVALALAVTAAALLLTAAGARASETLYWTNYDPVPPSIGTSNIDGSGGGPINSTGAQLEDPEGTALDTLGNRLYIASVGTTGKVGSISFVNLDGSGGGVFSAPGAPVNSPEGLTIDPATRTIYWLNTKTPYSLAWAKLDGSVGGVLNTTGAKLEGAYRLAIDTAGGRIYWGNNMVLGESSISYANLNNSGGGNLSIAGASPPLNISGLAIDPVAKRIYWVDNHEDKFSYASLSGGGGGDVNITGAAFKESAYGLALDPTLSKLYWANYGNKAVPTGAFGFVGLGGGGGAINIATAPVSGPQDPMILKSPTGAGAPALTRDPKAKANLTCSPGTWAADFPGSFVYQAPRTFAYQWTLNGTAIPAAIASTYSATSPGTYACLVTAANQAGAGSQTSAGVVVKAAKIKLTTKKKASVKAGGVATFKVKSANQGDLASKSAKVCAKLPKKAKKAVKAPKCKALGKVKASSKKSATLKFKVAEDALPGTYKVTFSVSGSAGKPAKAKIVVQG